MRWAESTWPGRSSGGSNDFLVYKYFPDGSFDTSFYTNGMGTYALNTDDWAHAIVLQTDGRIVVGGRSDPGGAGEFDFTFIRLLASGSYDTAFNTNGKLFIDFATTPDIIRGLALQTDGRIVAAGYTKSGTLFDFAFVRIETDGMLDTAFSTDGKYSVSVVANDDGAMSVALDSNGAIIGVGPAYNGTYWTSGFTRLLPTGSLDTSFFTSGKVTRTVVLNADEGPYSAQVDASNRIVAGGAGGTAIRGAGPVGFVYRLQTDGRFDTSFSTTGENYSIFSAISSNHGLNGLVLATDGLTIYAAGNADTSGDGNYDFFVTKVKSNGRFDTSFATQGWLKKALFASEDTAQAIAMKGDGVIYVVGRTYDGNSYEVALLRLDTSGALARSGDVVKSFGTDGYMTYDFNATTDSGIGILQDTSSRIIFVGQNNNNSNNMMMMRVLLNGNLDTSFNTNGKQEANGAANGADSAFKATVQTNGTILVAGVITGAGPRFGLAKLNTDGSFDTSFVTDGKYAIALGTAAYSVNVNTAGEILMVGKETTGSDLLAARLFQDGTLDTAFATDGSKTVAHLSNDSPNYAIMDAQQRVQVFYFAAVVGKTFGLVRWDTVGALDTTFKNSGLVGFTNACVNALYLETGGQGFVAMSNGSTLHGVTCSTAGATYPTQLFKYTSDGRVDTTFRTSGSFFANSVMTTAGFAVKALLATPNDQSYFQWDDGADFRVVRYLSDGNVDTTFSTDGEAILNSGVKDDPRGAVILDNGWHCGVGTAAATDAMIGCFWQ